MGSLDYDRHYDRREVSALHYERKVGFVQTHSEGFGIYVAQEIEKIPAVYRKDKFVFETGFYGYFGLGSNVILISWEIVVICLIASMILLLGSVSEYFTLFGMIRS